jgi:transcriptional regulator with XRE-family HTH domain
MRAAVYKGFADLIRHQRKNLGLTLADVAEALNCSIPYVSELERGVKEPPSKEKLRKLAGILKIEYAELVTESELSRRCVEVDLEGAGAKQRQLAVMLARRLDRLSDDEAQELIQQLSQLVGTDDEQDF